MRRASHGSTRWAYRCGQTLVRGLHAPGETGPGHLRKRYEPTRTKNVRGLMKRKIPHFRSEDEERRFWATADSDTGASYLAIPRSLLTSFCYRPIYRQRVVFSTGEAAGWDVAGGRGRLHGRGRP